MHTLRTAGGYAALVAASLYVLGFAAMATLLNPGNTETWSQADKLAFILDRKGLFQAWTLLIYVVFGAVLVVLAVAIHDWFKATASRLMPVATVFALIWAGLVIASGMVASVGLESVARMHEAGVADAVLAWSILGAVQDGLGGGVEVVGGLWVFLISITALRSGLLPSPLGWLGLLVGTAGILTIVPTLGELGAVFGLGQIAWFVWLGLRMLRGRAGEGIVAAD